MADDIRQRTFALALRVATLGRDTEYGLTVRRTIVRQLVRATFSVGANVEEAAGAHTKPDFIARMAIARKECREVNYWLRLAEETHVIDHADWPALRQEAMEVGRVVAAITRNAQRSSSR